jgi:hypothetical protein
MRPGLLATLGNRPRWTPAALSPLLWLDALDGSTITEAAGVVASWRDKGTARAPAATATIRPTYVASSLIGSRPAVRFTHAHRLEGTAAFAGDFSFFFVATLKQSGAATSARLFSVADTAATTDTTSANNLAVVIRGTTTVNIWSNVNGTLGTSRATTDDTPFLYSVTKSSTAIVNALNGGTPTSVASATTLASTRYVVGTSAGASGAFGSNYWDGDIGEIIAIPGIASQADRDRVDGYLAHRWGQASLLAASHPYKNAPP